MTSKSLKYFKFELDVHDYFPEIYTTANFHFNLSAGASVTPQICENYGFVTFFLVGVT